MNARCTSTELAVMVSYLANSLLELNRKQMPGREKLHFLLVMSVFSPPLSAVQYSHFEGFGNVKGIFQPKMKILSSLDVI